MNETKHVKQKAGLIAKAQGGAESLPVMSDGEEPPDMLLALLNNALQSMINSQQARIMGTARVNHNGLPVPTTIIFIFGTVPTKDGILEAVGNA